MRGFLRRLLASGPSRRSHDSRRVNTLPELARLEDRILLWVPFDKILFTATPSILTPADGRYVPVTVSGSLMTSTAKLPKGFFAVTDQYGTIEPHGNLTLTESTNAYTYAFSFQVTLQAKRGSQTKNGRQYNILVGGTDKDGTTGKTIAVLVPLNQAHPHGPASAHAAKAPRQH